jgi:hypothetical protein
MSSPSAPSHPFVRQECTRAVVVSVAQENAKMKMASPPPAIRLKAVAVRTTVDDERREKDCDEWPQPPHAIAAPGLNQPPEAP